MGKGGNHHTYSMGIFDTVSYTCACGKQFKFRNKKLIEKMITLHKTKCQHHKHTIDAGTGKFCNPVCEDYIYKETEYLPNCVESAQELVSCMVAGTTQKDILEQAEKYRDLHSKKRKKNRKKKRKRKSKQNSIPINHRSHTIKNTHGRTKTFILKKQ
jgi:hypothetical protein